MLTSLTDDLFEIDQYLIRNIKFRLAFREFGTSLGLQCQAEQTTMKDRAVDFKNWADSIIATWDPYMELSISEDMTPEDIRPITRVMYASALIPGGKLFTIVISVQAGAIWTLTGVIQLSVQDTWVRSLSLWRKDDSG